MAVQENDDFLNAVLRRGILHSPLVTDLVAVSVSLQGFGPGRSELHFKVWGRTWPL